MSELKLTNNQFKTVLESKIQNNELGLKDIIQFSLNILMKSERTFFLNNDTSDTNKANGYRYITPIFDGSLIELRVPRDRFGNFKPHILNLIKHNQQRLSEVAFTLYSSGMSTSQVGEVFEQIYGKSYSKSGISSLCEHSRNIALEWLERDLEEFYPAIYIDAHYNSVKRDKKISKEAFYVVLGVKEDFTREVLTVVNHPTESSTLWKEVFESLKKRGLKKVNLCVSDALIGVDEAVQESFYNIDVQLCTVHLKRELTKYIKPKDKPEFIAQMKDLFQAGNGNYKYEDALEKMEKIKTRWSSYPQIVKKFEGERIKYYFTYLEYNSNIQSMIYTTNWIERLNKNFKIAMNIRQSMPSSEAALALLSAVAIKMSETTYKYPIYNFKLEEKFKK
jgi:transposase-like protein